MTRLLRTAVFYTGLAMVAAFAVVQVTSHVADASEAKQATPYAPPVGIPAPTFGIDESHRMYRGKTFEAGGFKYRDAGYGPYTHYIDNTHPAATNEDNPFGTPEKPRQDIFDRLTVSLPAGSVVEIHGGPYQYEGWRSIDARGTRHKPVFVRAPSADTKVRFQGATKTFQMRLDASYFVLENIEFYDRAFPKVWGQQHHVALRYLEVHNPPGRGGAGGSAIGTGSGTQDMVVYKNHIHHNERVSIRDGKRTADDCHGVNVGSGIERIWILNKHIHHHWQVGVERVVIENNMITDFRLSALSLGTGVGNVTTLNNNLFWMNGKRVPFLDNLNTANPLDTYENRTFYAAKGEEIVDAWNRRGIKLKGTGNVVADPAMLIDPDGYPALKAESAAIDRGISSTHYDIFRKTYGLDIRVDITGHPRPEDNTWDIGAFEFRR